MLYLEDYLEMIEHLPQELRDRFTEMREMDLSVQNNMDSLEKRVKMLFAECRKSGAHTSGSDDEYQAIRKDYYRTLEDADEKVHLASQMYELVDRYLRRLDTELHKFKCELEADNKGITEVLEKRSLELDTPGPGPSVSSSQQKENRYRPRSEKRRDSNTSNHSSHEKRQANISTAIAESRHATAQSVPPSPSTVSYTLGHMGAGNAIAAAASQAIAATQQMQQGRRTASLKASYEAINTGVHVHEFGIGRELAGAAHTALQAIQQDQVNTKKQKKLCTKKKMPPKGDRYNTRAGAIPKKGQKKVDKSELEEEYKSGKKTEKVLKGKEGKKTEKSKAIKRSKSEKTKETVCDKTSSKKDKKRKKDDECEKAVVLSVKNKKGGSRVKKTKEDKDKKDIESNKENVNENENNGEETEKSETHKMKKKRKRIMPVSDSSSDPDAMDKLLEMKVRLRLTKEERQLQEKMRLLKRAKKVVREHLLSVDEGEREEIKQDLKKLGIQVEGPENPEAQEKRLTRAEKRQERLNRELIIEEKIQSELKKEKQREMKRKEEIKQRQVKQWKAKKEKMRREQMKKEKSKQEQQSVQNKPEKMQKMKQLVGRQEKLRLERKRKWSASASASSSTSVAIPQPLPTPAVVPPPAVSPPLETPPQASDSGDAEWTYDPNEPRYCICNQVSYGDMVACDNEDESIAATEEENLEH